MPSLVHQGIDPSFEDSFIKLVWVVIVPFKGSGVVSETLVSLLFSGFLLIAGMELERDFETMGLSVVDGFCDNCSNFFCGNNAWGWGGPVIPSAIDSLHWVCSWVFKVCIGVKRVRDSDLEGSCRCLMRLILEGDPGLERRPEDWSLHDAPWLVKPGKRGLRWRGPVGRRLLSNCGPLHGLPVHLWSCPRW